jgi:4-amino-4-deoxy-L-arabinose transferase-like glycosyltransferase/putative flippase GtrA
MPIDFIKHHGRRALAYRFIRFGTVGASGTVVNLATLYLAQEYLFVSVASDETRLNLSLALAIFIATLNNFGWNRLWTWHDRTHHHTRPLIFQFIQYSTACWISIVIQFALTRLLATQMHYLPANLIAILSASVFNYFINDRWTFSRLNAAKLINPLPMGKDRVRDKASDSSTTLSSAVSAFSPHPIPSPAGEGLNSNAYLLAALILAVFTYFYALDSKNAPTNGDEAVYAHITRLTAASGHLLPLQSQLDHMRNTKPPLLFWQGIASTDWGQHWNRFSLRYPSVLYTLATALMIFLLGKKLGGATRTGLLAALVYLAFFDTYRYGRPFLTSAAEVFWLFLPFFVLLYWKQRAYASRWRVPLGLGSAIGIGLLYKSFALLAPVGLGLSGWYLHERRYTWPQFLKQDAYKLVLIGSVALAVFSLWFVFDPDPAAVFREFVVGENLGKFEAGEQSYLRRLIWGSQSIWSLFLAVFINAGLLAPLLLGLMWITWRAPRTLTREEQLLWIWFAVLFVVFSLPSQRSGRYLLPAMPALALLCALRWTQLPRAFFLLVHGLGTVVLALLAWLSIHLYNEAPDSALYAPWYWGVIAGALAMSLAGLLRPDWSRDLAPVAAIAALLVLGGFLHPFDGPLGQFSPESMRVLQAQAKPLGVPCNFRAKDEGYRFELPDVNVRAYAENTALTRQALAQRFPFFIADIALPDAACNGCKVISQRFIVRSRQSSQEIRASIRDGKLFQLLISRQVLVDARAVSQPLAEVETKDCR